MVALRLLLNHNRPASHLKSDRLPTTHQILLAPTPIVHQVPSRSSSAPAGRQSPVSMDTDSDFDFSDRPPVDIFVEEGELSDQDPDAAATDPDQTLSEDQNYRETMRGIRSFMGWTHIPDMDSAAATSDDNPFAGPKSQPTAKVSVKMPTDEWLCRKMGKLNLTLVKDILHVARKREAYSKISLCDQPDLRANGMGLCPTNRKVILDLGKLFHHGVPILPKLTAPIAV